MKHTNASLGSSVEWKMASDLVNLSALYCCLLSLIYSFRFLGARSRFCWWFNCWKLEVRRNGLAFVLGATLCQNKFICSRFCFNFVHSLYSNDAMAMFCAGLCGAVLCVSARGGFFFSIFFFGDAPVMYNNEIIKMKINNEQINFFVLSVASYPNTRYIYLYVVRITASRSTPNPERITFECQSVARPMIYLLQVECEARKMK